MTSCGPLPPRRRSSLPPSTCLLTSTLAARTGAARLPSAARASSNVFTGLCPNDFSADDSDVSRPHIDAKEPDERKMPSSNHNAPDERKPSGRVTFSPATALHPLTPDILFSTVHKYHASYDLDTASAGSEDAVAGSNSELADPAPPPPVAVELPSSVRRRMGKTSSRPAL